MKQKKGNYKHGMRHTRLYNIWRSMRQRCSNPNNSRYHIYGGRGIKVCGEWEGDFMSFYTWAMEHGYSDELSLDRIETNGNYEPKNCRWVTYKIQNNNRRDNIKIEFNGQQHTLSEWADITGIKRTTLWNRFHKGWPIESILTITPGDKN